MDTQGITSYSTNSARTFYTVETLVKKTVIITNALVLKIQAEKTRGVVCVHYSKKGSTCLSVLCV